MNETPHTECERSLRDLLEVIFRHKTKGAFFLLIVMTTALGILAFIPGDYTSTAKLMVRRGRDGSFPDPSSASGNTLPLYKEWESEINTELEIIGSRELVIDVTQQLGCDLFLNGPAASKPGMLKPVRMVLNPIRQWIINTHKRLTARSEEKPGSAGQGQLDKAVRIVEKNLLIEARKKSDIITVSYTASHPELARQVVEQLVDIYLDKRIEVHRVPGAHQFFGQQTDQLMKELKRTEESISTIRSSAGIGSLEDSRQALRTSIEAVTTLRLRNESDLAAANARVATLQAMLETQSPESATSKNGTLLDRTELKTMQATLRSEEIKQAALIAEANKLTQQLMALTQEMADINALETPIRTLEREQELLEDKYRKYSEDVEDARINEELETRKISNVSIVQHATLPVKANPSGKLFKLLAALFMGLTGAIVIAFGASALDPTLHTQTDIATRLHLNTWVELPRLRGSELYFFVHPHDPTGQPKHLGKESKQRIEDAFKELLFKIIAQKPGTTSAPIAIGITSTAHGEGVSSIAANLADSFARDDRFPDTLLLDTDTQRPFGNLEEQMESAPYTYQPIYQPENSETTAPAPEAIPLMLEQLEKAKKKNHDVIVVDLPPVSPSGCTLRMAHRLDGILFVVADGQVPWRDAQRAAEFLTGSRAKIYGVVLNRKTYPMPQWLYRKL